MAGAFAAPLIAHAQALPNEVRNAGVTLVMWQSVQTEVHHSAVEKRVSEQALSAVCAKMGVELARGHRFDVNQLISLISGRADEINALYDRLSVEEQENDPAATALLKTYGPPRPQGDLLIVATD